MRVERLDTTVLTLATEQQPESDGTLSWDSTTMVLVECSAAGVTGVGYTYAHAATARLIEQLLSPCVLGLDAMATAEAHTRMARALRNQGREGIMAAALSAVDNALWDLKARLLEVSLAALLGLARTSVPVYASGGFTSSNLDALQRELADYAAQGFRQVKIKVGRTPAEDPARVRAAREALGPDIALMVDANGAYQRKQALQMAERFVEHGVVWFEEPVSSDDLDGLRLLRDRGPAGMAIAAGEYGYTSTYFLRMLGSGAVDVLQADATRCAGVTGFLEANALCAAHCLRLSSHCAPALHCQLDAAASQLFHLEYFRDHVRMEERLFSHTPRLEEGSLHVDTARPGLGIELRRDELKRYRA